jgi:hypothetical protein
MEFFAVHIMILLGQSNSILENPYTPSKAAQLDARSVSLAGLSRDAGILIALFRRRCCFMPAAGDSCLKGEVPHA